MGRPGAAATRGGASVCPPGRALSPGPQPARSYNVTRCAHLCAPVLTSVITPWSLCALAPPCPPSTLILTPPAPILIHVSPTPAFHLLSYPACTLVCSYSPWTPVPSYSPFVPLQAGGSNLLPSYDRLVKDITAVDNSVVIRPKPIRPTPREHT